MTAGWFITHPAAPSGYNAIYILDSEHKAVDYPVTLVANQNSTFNVYVGVENHMGATTQYQVLVKVTSNLSLLPVDAPAQNATTLTLSDGQTWQSQQTITQNQTGDYSVVFELWQYNAATSAYEFTDNAPVLNIQVVS